MQFELLLCVGESENGPSLPVINELREEYPHVDVKVFEGESVVVYHLCFVVIDIFSIEATSFKSP